jgi:hypothetical protein
MKHLTGEHAEIAEERKKQQKGLPDKDIGANISRCAAFSAVFAV